MIPLLHSLSPTLGLLLLHRDGYSVPFPQHIVDEMSTVC